MKTLLTILPFLFFSCTKDIQPKNVFLVLFDGYHMAPNAWSDTAMDLDPSGLSTEQKQIILDSMQAFLPGAVVTTIDVPGKREQKVVFTTTYQPFCVCGGKSLRFSLIRNAGNPAFVFPSLHKYNTRNIWIAALHEIGHTYGLSHQTDDGIMNGVGLQYSAPYAHWSTGTNAIGDYQDDPQIIDSINQH